MARAAATRTSRSVVIDDSLERLERAGGPDLGQASARRRAASGSWSAMRLTSGVDGRGGAQRARATNGLDGHDAVAVADQAHQLSGVGTGEPAGGVLQQRAEPSAPGCAASQPKIVPSAVGRSWSKMASDRSCGGSSGDSSSDWSNCDSDCGSLNRSGILASCTFSDGLMPGARLRGRAWASTSEIGDGAELVRRQEVQHEPIEDLGDLAANLRRSAPRRCRAAWR